MAVNDSSVVRCYSTLSFMNYDTHFKSYKLYNLIYSNIGTWAN